MDYRLATVHNILYLIVEEMILFDYPEKSPFCVRGTKLVVAAIPED